ncbi:MAG: HAMP domain-containing protein [Elusimicrobiota bacterium]
MVKYKRKIYLTEKKYQLKFTLVMMLAVLIGAGVIGGLTYWELSTKVTPERLNQLVQWDAYIIRVLLLLGATFLAGIFLSHKVIGPVKRVEWALENIRKGNFDINLQLRTADEFLKIADEINSIAEKLEDLSREDQKIKQKFSE